MTERPKDYSISGLVEQGVNGALSEHNIEKLARFVGAVRDRTRPQDGIAREFSQGQWKSAAPESLGTEEDPIPQEVMDAALAAKNVPDDAPASVKAAAKALARLNGTGVSANDLVAAESRLQAEKNKLAETGKITEGAMALRAQERALEKARQDAVKIRQAKAALEEQKRESQERLAFLAGRLLKDQQDNVLNMECSDALTAILEGKEPTMPEETRNNSKEEKELWELYRLNEKYGTKAVDVTTADYSNIDYSGITPGNDLGLPGMDYLGEGSLSAATGNSHEAAANAASHAQHVGDNMKHGISPGAAAMAATVIDRSIGGNGTMTDPFDTPESEQRKGGGEIFGSFDEPTQTSLPQAPATLDEAIKASKKTEPKAEEKELGLAPLDDAPVFKETSEGTKKPAAPAAEGGEKPGTHVERASASKKIRSADEFRKRKDGASTESSAAQPEPMKNAMTDRIDFKNVLLAKASDPFAWSQVQVYVDVQQEPGTNIRQCKIQVIRPVDEDGNQIGLDLTSIDFLITAYAQLISKETGVKLKKTGVKEFVQQGELTTEQIAGQQLEFHVDASKVDDYTFLRRINRAGKKMQDQLGNGKDCPDFLQQYDGIIAQAGKYIVNVNNEEALLEMNALGEVYQEYMAELDSAPTIEREKEIRKEMDELEDAYNARKAQLTDDNTKPILPIVGGCFEDGTISLGFQTAYYNAYRQRSVKFKNEATGEVKTEMVHTALSRAVAEGHVKVIEPTAEQKAKGEKTAKVFALDKQGNAAIINGMQELKIRKTQEHTKLAGENDKEVRSVTARANDKRNEAQQKLKDAQRLQQEAERLDRGLVSRGIAGSNDKALVTEHADALFADKASGIQGGGKRHKRLTEGKTHDRIGGSGSSRGGDSILGL